VPLLFVYGTLMYGMEAHGLLVGSLFAGRGYTRGALYSCNGYPLLVLDEDGRVWGELYHVDAAQLARIDHYEGVDLGSPWRRVRVRVFIDGVEVRAFAYGSRRVEAERLCGRLRSLGLEDYGVVAGRRHARWLVAVPEGLQPPGLHLGVDSGVVENLYWNGRCFEEDGGERILLYDLLASREELEEWARSLGCSLGGVEASKGGFSVYPYAPLASGAGVSLTPG